MAAIRAVPIRQHGRVMPKMKQPDPKTIGGRIWLWRNYLKLTVDEVAAKIPVTKGALSRWEQGTSQLKETSMAAAAKALGLSVAQLLKGPPQPDAADPSMVERAVSVVETADPDDVATWVAMGERLRKRKLPD